MKKSIVAIAAVLLVGAGAYSLYSVNQQEPSQSVQTTQTVQKESNLTFSNEGKTVAYQGIEGKTALVILESLTDVAKEESEYGEFVTGINGKIAQQNTEYWSFYVNGSYANEGAGTYITKDSDAIEWRLESIQQ